MRLDRIMFVISMTSLLLTSSLLFGPQRHASWAAGAGPGDGYYGGGGAGGGERSPEIGQETDEWDRRVREYNERLRWYDQRIVEKTNLISMWRRHETDPDLTEQQRKHARDMRLQNERERARLEIGRSGLVP